jgi:hypothetical protein
MNKVGFCAVHFQHAEKYTRWAIQDRWKPLGEHTLMQVKCRIATAMAENTVDPSIPEDELVEIALQDLVVEAAAQMDVKAIPCRSYALMLHLGAPCFLIKVAPSEPSSIHVMPTDSWQEADRLVDRFDEARGDTYVRIRSQGDHIVILSPDGLPNPTIAPGTLTGLLQPLEEEIQAALGHTPTEGLQPVVDRARPDL